MLVRLLDGGCERGGADTAGVAQADHATGRATGSGSCRKLHSLEAILVIAICAVIAGASDFQQVALFGQKRKDWLKRFLALPNGIPSHDTFERVFARVDSLAFQECFAGWMNAW